MSGTPITVVGNLGGDPELRLTPSGVPVATFSVAVTERQINRETGQWEDAGTTWWRTSCWRSLAEGVSESLSRGMRVIVTGTVRSREWTDEKSGERKIGWEILAASVGPDLTWSTAKVVRNPKADQALASEDPRGAGAAVHRTRPSTGNAGAPPDTARQNPPTSTSSSNSGGYRPDEEPPF